VTVTPVFPRLGMSVAEITPTASQHTQRGKMQSAERRLSHSRRAREARGESTPDLTVEAYGHINSAGCKEMATVTTLMVTAAHHSIWQHSVTACILHKSPIASSLASVSCLIQKVRWAHCGDENSFWESTIDNFWMRRHTGPPGD